MPYDGNLEITNAGKIEISGSTYITGVVLEAAAGIFSGSMANGGIIELDVTGSGSVNAFAYGIKSISGDMAGTITNSGLIEVRAFKDAGTTANLTQVTAAGIDALTISGTITNSGDIVATASGGDFTTKTSVGIRANLLAASGIIINTADALINVYPDTYAYGINVESGTYGDITNRGRILAGQSTYSAISTASYAVGITANNFSGTLVNQGEITAIAQVSAV